MYVTNIINLAPIATPAAFAALIKLADEPCTFVKFTRAGSGLEFIRSSNGQLLIIRRSVVLPEKQKRLDWCEIATNEGLIEMFDRINEYLVTKDVRDFPNLDEIFDLI